MKSNSARTLSGTGINNLPFGHLLSTWPLNAFLDLFSPFFLSHKLCAKVIFGSMHLTSTPHPLRPLQISITDSFLWPLHPCLTHSVHPVLFSTTVSGTTTRYTPPKHSYIHKHSVLSKPRSSYKAPFVQFHSRKMSKHATPFPSEIWRSITNSRGRRGRKGGNCCFFLPHVESVYALTHNTSFSRSSTYAWYIKAK